MKNKPLYIYLGIVAVLSCGFIIFMKYLGEKGNYLAGIYMLTPAISAIITRIFFYKNRFNDALINRGSLKHYFLFWAISLGISAGSYIMFYLFGAITLDISGKTFLQQLKIQLESSGTSINSTLPEGISPEMMLLLFSIGGLTVFNILPGLITGLGEELGWRGFMFPALYKISPLWGFLGGGLIWFLWHLPLAFIIPQTTDYTGAEIILNFIVLGIGSVCTFIYLAYVMVKTQNIFIAAIAHITLNNAARSFSYYVILQNQLLANLGLTITMLIVILILYKSGQFKVFTQYFSNQPQKLPLGVH